MTAVSSLAHRAQSQDVRANLRTLAIWGALIILGYLPLLVRFATEQWARAQYQFFPLIILAAIYLAWQRLQEMPAEPRPGSKAVGYTAYAFALILMLAASVLWSGRLAAMSAWLMLAGTIWTIGGRTLLRAMAPSQILLALVIGVPLGLDDLMLQRLREVAVFTSSSVLVWLGVPHLASGTVLEITGHRLLVAEACSGINSMMAVLGFTLVLSFLRHRRFLTSASLLAFGVLFVLWTNTVRIAGGAYLKSKYDVDILSGEVHEWASIVLFCVSMLLIISIDELIQVVGQWWQNRNPNRRPDPASPEIPVSAAHLSVRPLLSRGLWIFAIAFALLGGAQVVNASRNGGLAWWVWGADASHLPNTAVFTMPHELSAWTRAEEVEKFLVQPEIEGKRSQSWLYRSGDITAIVAVDFPFPGYHDLTVCYRNAGWTVDSLKHDYSNPAQQSDIYSTVLLSRLNEGGYLWFSMINELGAWVEPPLASATGRLADRVEHLGRPDWNAPTYQIQIWVQSFTPLTDAQQQSVRQLFLAARPEFARQFVKQLEGAK